MSVPAGPTFKRYVASGVATVYPIPFLVLDAADLQITLDGVLVTSGFTLTGIGNPTSTCTFSVAPTGDLLFQQNIPFQRLNDYQELGDFMASTVNRDLDRLWLAVKQLSGGTSRALTVSPLEPEGIPPIPLKAARALRVLAFNSVGDPIVSTLTLQQLEEQPALALASAQAAAASASAAAGSASSASTSASSAAASAASVVGAAVPMFQVSWWPGTRAAIPNGYVPGDGQALSRTAFPDAWAAINAGNMPTATDAAWNSTPAERGKYTAGDGSTTFRVPDYNGKTAGSIAPLMVRGDGAVGFSTGSIRQDQMQLITGDIGGVQARPDTTNGVFTRAVAATNNWIGTASSLDNIRVGFDSSRVARTGSETFPTHVVGCWIIKLFGAVTNPGAVDVVALASALATLTADFQNSRAGSFANTFLHVEDRKATNTAGGTATAATWTTRDLNSVRVNRIPGSSVASNQITLPAGTYRFDARAPAIGVGAHQIRLRNITDAADVDTGSSGFSVSSGLNAMTDSVIGGEFTIAATKVFEIQHNVGTTRATNGFGAAANLGTTEIYTQAKFWRLA
ncbi:phage tail protein [Pseudomonas sichuanensis]|uniref:phage tail protein n=1 Tax=Pseudomonas sichuanensis TaxID=2213015 RepID=UPI000DA6C32D|nr:phage tail protein [Pseudomonas sichuanensis]